jgi:uncharacterized protein (DUF736 family)
MSEYDNTNRGAIFKNEHKKTENHPDYRGTINVDGVDKEISLWVKTSKAGKKFFSASIQEPYVATGQTPQASEEAEDDMPF